MDTRAMTARVFFFFSLTVCGPWRACPQLLTADTMNHVNSILPAGETLESDSTWADDVRYQKGWEVRAVCAPACCPMKLKPFVWRVSPRLCVVPPAPTPRRAVR